MIGKELTKITEDDLQSLVDNVVLEDKTIEYKASLPGNSDVDKKEFLADVSSFANASGGDIIFGISEDPVTREPKILEGIEINNIDQAINRLDQIIREGIEPRIPSVNIRSVGLTNGRKVIIIRLGKSWLSPHRVKFGGHDKFYARSSNGKHPMDVGELRIAFTLSETIAERIRRFREERIARLYANETPVPFYGGAKIVLHIVPFISFTPGQRFDIGGVVSSPSTRPEPMRSGGYNSTYTLEGFITYSSTTIQGESKAYSYAHLYRNGTIEYVESSMFREDSKHKIPSVPMERLVIETVVRSIAVLATMDAPPPFFVFLTLVGIRGYGLEVPRENFYVDGNPHPIDTDVLFLPEAVVEKNRDVPKDIKHTIDAVWNACGYPGSTSYDANGEWIWMTMAQ